MINALTEKIKKTNAPVVVGLDPMLSYVPEMIKDAAFAQFGETPEGAAEAIWQYNKGIVDAVYDLIPAVKPQIAMYEQFGVEGLKAFQKTVDYCHEKGLVVIGDLRGLCRRAPRKGADRKQGLPDVQRGFCHRKPLLRDRRREALYRRV